MIRVTIDLHPGGDSSRAETLHTLDIWRTTARPAAVNEYRYWLRSGESRPIAGAGVTHTYNDGVLVLVAKVLADVERGRA